MFGKRKMISLMAFTFLFAFTACDDNDDDVPEPDEAQFSLEVSGDMELELEGDVIFSDVFDPEYDEHLFTLSMMPPTDLNTILTFIKGGSRPGTGSHPIVSHDENQGEFFDDAFVSWFNLQMGEGEGTVIYFFQPTGGEIVFEESSDDFVSGSFEYQAVGGNVHDETSEKDVVLSGTFAASRINTGGVE